jgi:hypothetical protein
VYDRLVRWTATILMLSSAGCSALFGLETPKLGDAGGDAVTDGLRSIA